MYSTTGRFSAGWAIFCVDVLQDRLVQAQLRDQPLEPSVLLLQLLELTHLVGLKPGVLLLPAIERLLRDPTRRITSATGRPSSACFSTATICSTDNRFLFTANLPPPLRLSLPETHPAFGPRFPMQ